MFPKMNQHFLSTDGEISPPLVTASLELNIGKFEPFNVKFVQRCALSLALSHVNEDSLL